MGIGRGGGRSLMGPILTVNLVVYVILVCLAGWSVDKYIDGQQNHPHLGGNESTVFLLVFALTGGTIGGCSLLAGVGVGHLRAWRTDSLAATATSCASLALAITAVAFGFMCKQIILGGHRGKRLKTLEAFVAISMLSQLLYLLLLHLGFSAQRTDEAAPSTPPPAPAAASSSYRSLEHHAYVSR